MVVKLILASAGHGKTAYAIDAIRALPPLSPARVLVPDQLAAEAFRRRMAQAGGTFGVQVQTFYGLYADVLSLAGGALQLPQPQPEQGMAYLTPAVRQRLIQHLAETLHNAGRLTYYAPVRSAPGFARLLGTLFGELKRARLFPEDLDRALAQSEPRLAELAHLYTVYQDWLLETGWIDADGQGWLAAIALEQNPSLLSDLALLVVDGFDEFNPTQLHLLRLLAGRAAGTLVTLIGDPQRPGRLAHRRLARARTVLQGAFDVEAVSLARERPVGSLSHLEASLFEAGATARGSACRAGEAVTFVEAQNRAAEAREALRWLKARLVRDRLSFIDVAVIARDVTPYRVFLQEVADEFGIPLCFASGAPLHANPAVAALLNLLALPLDPDPWSPRALIDVLTSPYLDWSGCGLEPGDADRLHDVASAGQVIAGLEQWRDAFQRLMARRRDHDYEEGGPLPKDAPAGTEAARLAEAFESVVSRLAPPSQATLRQRASWLEELVGDDPAQAGAGLGADEGDDGASLRIVARARGNVATAERDIAALRAFKDILRAQVLAEAVIDGGRGADGFLSHDQFVAGLAQVAQETAFTGPTQGEAILVSSVLEARGLTFDAVALLGLSEGGFPAAEREDVLLREPDRARLGSLGFAIEPRLRGDEVTFFYQAVTRARRRLLICRPYLADDGQPWEASPYWTEARRLFDDAEMRRVRPADPVSDVASEQELVDVLPGDRVRDALAVLHARSPGSARSPWHGDLSSLAERLAERFGPDRPWSSSRLETYTKCPLYFWTAYVMALEPRELPQTGYDVLALGSIYHLVLERLYNRVPDGDPDRLRAALPAVAQQVYENAPNDYGFRPTPLWARQQEEMTEVLRRTVEALIEVSGPYVPLTQELPFGLRGRPPLALYGDPSAAQQPALLLRGYIDRVDRAPDGGLRIIDYKAGSTPISARDLWAGRRLQLPLYALAARDALGTDVVSGFYWHIGSAKPSSLKLEKYAPKGAGGGKRGVAGAIETSVDYATEIGAAVCGGQFAPAPADDECPRFCPAAAFCEWYRPGR